MRRRRSKRYLKVIDVLNETDASMRCEATRVLYCSVISQTLSETDVLPYER